ncbi:MAG TPA: GNAT family N-acetyltransferase [Bryobacteraceae bacterium]|nr:GNAT family N-acetyltransferase [Bryobacteraceae bacterium]
MIEVRPLDPRETRRCATDLAAVLVDCVAGGASVSFMPPFGHADAEVFFRAIADGVEAGERILLAAFNDERLVGTVQIVTALPPNQPHRADIAKLLVHRPARGRGIARALMEEAERIAAAAGKTLLVLDTATGDAAERLYVRMDWVKVGVIPKYALYPDGRWTATTIFYKELAPVTLGGK